MRKTKAVEIDGKTYVVRELTPLEIDGLFDASRKGPSGVVDSMLDVHCLDTVLLGAMLDVSPERCAEIVGNTVPSRYARLIDAAKEVNADFFVMARRRIEYAGQIGAINEILASASASASPSSSPTATQTPGITA